MRNQGQVLMSEQLYIHIYIHIHTYTYITYIDIGHCVFTLGKTKIDVENHIFFNRQCIHVYGAVSTSTVVYPGV